MAARISADQLGQVYLQVFDDFAVGTEEIAEEFGVSMTVARNALKRLEDMGLVSGDYVGMWSGNTVKGAHRGQSKAVPGQSLCWQANPSYDEISREEAIALAESHGLTFPDRQTAPNPLEPTGEPADDQAALLEAMALEIMKLRAENIELLRRENIRLQAMALRGRPVAVTPITVQ